MNLQPLTRRVSEPVLVCLFLLTLITTAYTQTPSISASDPCTCLNNSTTLDDGQFSETITVTGTPGETWTVFSAVDFYQISSPNPPAIPFPINPGTPLTESPAGSGNFILEGKHIDAQPYAVIVENGVGEQLSISNVCYYPDVEILNLGGTFCLNSLPVLLEAETFGINGDTSFLINGVPDSVFNPLTLGVGTHWVELTFDAGTATPNDLSDPGCESVISIQVEVIETESVVACDNNLNVSLNQNCEAPVMPDMLLEGIYSCFDDYSVLIIYQFDTVPNPVPGDFIGKQLIGKVEHLPSGNSCIGYFKVEDKLAPSIDCEAVTIECYQNAEDVPPPTASDNCDPNPTENLINEIIDPDDPCVGVQITRTWSAFDEYLNISDTCEQVITVAPPPLPSFPPDRLWTCNEYATYPNVLDATPFTGDLETTGSGTPTNINGIWCLHNVEHTDQIIQTCGNSFYVVRSWVVLNWCTGEIVQEGASGEDYVQLVTVMDVTPPVISKTPFTVSANVAGSHPEPCRSQDFLPAAEVSDDCNAYSVRIYTPVGEAVYSNGVNGLAGGFIPAPGLTQGTHIITYKADDECGNVSELKVEIEVIDDIAPNAICDHLTAVSISSTGKAEVFASVFDDGSYDNCGIESMTVRRLTDNCGIPGNTDFGETITFCCSDASETPHDIEMMVTDYNGHYNICSIQVLVEDKQTPLTIFCPSNHTVTCDFYWESLEAALSLGDYSILDPFGWPEFKDNCDFEVTQNVQINIDQCGVGSITRTFQAVDESGNGPTTCIQNIFTEHISDWVIEFPEDLTATCEDELPEFGEPEISFKTCELTAVSFEDDTFNIVPDACFKIIRTWTAINWCVAGSDIDQETVEMPESGLGLPFPSCDLDGDGDCDDLTFQDSRTASGIFDTDPDLDPWDGYITFQQSIKVIDEIAPEITCPDPVEFCITEEDCLTTLELPQPEVTDCSGDLDIHALSAFGQGFGPFYNVDLGDRLVIYSATDNCGNTTSCQVIMTVSDCKKPAPKCKNGLIIELMDTDPPMVEIWAEDFNDGSSDNCTNNIEFSFSNDLNDQSMTFGCYEIGQQNIELWVSDEAGNQDFCSTFVIIQDNQELCIPDPIISGLISTEMNEAISDVTVKLSGDIVPNQITDFEGMYEFPDLEADYDYTIVPSKDINPLNGVTTYDMVLVRKHVLNTELLDSPYKLLAADVNNSGTITTLDLVQMRKLILHIEDNFPNSESWQFVPKDFEFADPNNPWQAMSVITVNNLDGDITDADFIGIKTGDVNNSANPNNLLTSDDRNFTDKTFFDIKDFEIRSGEIFEIDFKMSTLRQIEGWQFSLNFDQNALNFIDIIESDIVKRQNFGLAKLAYGTITSSWFATENYSKDDESKILFKLKFRALENVQINELFDLKSTFTKTEAYRKSGELLELSLRFNESGLVFDYEGVHLNHNQPNPFAQRTTISFMLPEACQVSVIITDIRGKKLKDIKGHFEKGLHEIPLTAHDLGLPGLYFCRLSALGVTKTQKMVFNYE